MNPVLRWLALVLCMLGLVARAAEAQMDEPRAYGHVIGDVLTRLGHLPLPAGRTLDIDRLPRPGRVDAWLELLSVEREPASGGVTLRLRYQVINVGNEVATTVLPALKLPLTGGAAGEAVELPDWPVHISPLTAPFAVARGALDEMQPDIVPVREPLGPIVLRLALCGVALALLALPLLLRRFPQLAFWRRRAPFLEAWRDLARIDDTPRALARLHAAFDASAGGAVFAQRLDTLYDARPGLLSAADEIEAFFAASRALFFAQAGGAEGWTPARVRALAHRLARLEGARA